MGNYEVKQRTKLIIDTDIGTDVDDAYALLFALASPDIDLKLVSLVHANLDVRAQIAAKLLTLAKRPDVPLAKGISGTLRGDGRMVWIGHEGAGIDFSDVAGFPVRDDGVSAIIETVERYPGEVVVCPIGPMTNIAAAIEKAPESMRKVKGFSIMASSFRGVGKEVAEIEHNVACDAEAADMVLNFGAPVRLVGLNVTLQVLLKRPDVQVFRGPSPLAGYMLAMTEKWFEVIKQEESAMHDPLAVASVVSPGLVTTGPFCARVVTEGADSGKTVFADPEAGRPVVDVCTGVDSGAFRELFLKRIERYVEETS